MKVQQFLLHPPVLQEKNADAKFLRVQNVKYLLKGEG